MKRRNVQMAFVGEGTPESTDITGMEDGDEAVDIEVLGGTLMVTVPAGTPDSELFQQPNVLGGELRLENGLVLSFQIEDGATGAQFTTTPQGERADTHEGLSSLPNVPGGA